MRGGRGSGLLVGVSACALAFPGAAWAPWETISDAAVNILQVCRNGIQFEYANGTAEGHDPSSTLGDRLGVRAGAVEPGTNKPSESAPLILDATFTAPHQHFNVPTLPPDGTDLRHYSRTVGAAGPVTLFWSSEQAVGTALRLIFAFPDEMDLSADLPFSSSPALTIADCTLAGTSVGLRSFSARRARGGVAVRWRTASEHNTLGFNVYRGQRAGRLRLNRTLIPGSAATGRARTGSAYSWLDRKAPRRTVRYWLQEIEIDGSRAWYGPVSIR